MNGFTQRVSRPWREGVGLGRPAVLAVLALTLALAGCSVVGPRDDPFGTRSDPAVSAPPGQCVPEGGSCAADRAACCAGSTCAGGRGGVCILAY
jgi:hypothetical protein